MAGVSRDSDRAAAIGNTQALQEVLQRRTLEVAKDRVASAPETVADVAPDQYALVLGTLLMNLIDNERTNATTRAFKLSEANEAALVTAVQQIRSS